MDENIEDTISRNRKFQEEMRLKIERLKAFNAPDIIIENQEMISKMTLAEYKIYCRELEEEEKKFKAWYIKNNPIEKSIVDEIYTRESKLEFDYFTYFSNVHWNIAINPLSFMSEDHYKNDLYEPFMKHAHEIYRERFEEDMKKKQIEFNCEC